MDHHERRSFVVSCRSLRHSIVFVGISRYPSPRIFLRRHRPVSCTETSTWNTTFISDRHRIDVRCFWFSPVEQRWVGEFDRCHTEWTTAPETEERSIKKRVLSSELTELVLSDMRMTVCRNLSARSAEMGGVRSKTSRFILTARFRLVDYFCRSNTWISIPVSARCVDRSPRRRSPLGDSVFALVWWFSSFARESTRDVACRRILLSMDRMWHESDDWSSLDER